MAQDAGTPPAEADREALVRVISEAESATDDEGSWALPEEVADAILAAGFRRHEPAPVTDTQVEAGAQAAFLTDDLGGHIRGPWTWETIPEEGRRNYRSMVRAVIEAARSVTADQENGSLS